MSTAIEPIKAAELEPQGEARSFLEMISQAARDPNVQVEKLERLMAMKERFDKDQAKIAFDIAMAEIQARVPRITKDGRVLNRDGTIKSKFAKYEDIDIALRPLMNEYGFSISFTAPEFRDGLLWITAHVRHKGGHAEPTTVPVALDASMKSNSTGNPLRSPAQDMGSTISYGKRYAKCAAFDIVTTDEDDDAQGEGAKPLTEDETRKIEDWLQQIGGTQSVRQAFAAYLQKRFGFTTIGELKRRDFESVISALRNKAEGK